MLKKLAFTAALAFMLCFNVFAEEKSIEDCEDYIVKYKEPEITLYSQDEEKINDEFAVMPKEDAEKLLEEGVAEYIEPDQQVEIYENEYNDDYYSGQVYMDKMNIPYLQSLYTGEVRIAVIDSGINRLHPDLVNANIETGYNYVENSTDTTDLYNHGTRVASVIAATPNNGIGIAGIAPECTIVPLVCITAKTVNGEVVTSNGKVVTVGTLSNILKALNDATNKYNCKIINMSLGVSQYSASFESAVNEAARKGVIIISAAGNDGNTSNAGNYNYPASFDNTVSVGAVNQYYELTYYTQRNDKVDVSAVYGNTFLPNNIGGYSSGGGTSFAAPVITGMVALLVSRYPDLDISDIKNIIKAASADIVEEGKDYSGYGCLMGDAMAELTKYRQKIFVSPYIEGSTERIKLYKGDIDENCILVCAFYENGIFKRWETRNISFDSDDLFYTAVEKATEETTKFFVWNSLDGQRSFSSVR